jgi:hypothetical protein
LDIYLHEIFLCRIEARTNGSYETTIADLGLDLQSGHRRGREVYRFLPTHPPRGEQSRATNFVYLLRLRRRGNAVSRQGASWRNHRLTDRAFYGALAARARLGPCQSETVSNTCATWPCPTLRDYQWYWPEDPICTGWPCLLKLNWQIYSFAKS